MQTPTLLTDLYQLTMLAGYLEKEIADKPAVFDLYFRTNPFQGGYAVFAGLATALDYLENLAFAPKELEYLAGLKFFKPRFIDFLRAFRFRGRVTAVPEGTLVFAHEPLLTVEGTLAEAQFVETALLNIINFQTLTATKAARICQAARGSEVMEFGLRRSQGPDGALSASRAAFIGGCVGTSNVLAGMLYGLPLRGTHAHSWVQAFPDELTAFRAYADTFPDSTILLVDTYDTLKSGVTNAITVGHELQEKGLRLRGIRIDSGDLAYLSREARRMLDEAGLGYVRIVASNDLDEHIIESVCNERGLVDVYGVGTNLVTCAGAGGGALGGVYKLVSIDGAPKMKSTSEVAKATLPGRKRLFRILTADGNMVQDVVCLHDDSLIGGETVSDPANPLQHTRLPDEFGLADIRQVVMENGRRTMAEEPLVVMAQRCRDGIANLPPGCARLVNPHRYKVSITERLNGLRETLHNQWETA